MKENPPTNNRVFSRAEEKAHALGYRITPDGDVISPRGKRMATRQDKCGRLYFHAGQALTVRVHRMQAFQKFGEQIYTPGLEVRHLDGNAVNNTPGNLELGTKSQNEMDKRPEVRRAAALKATERIRKYDHATVLAYMAHNSFAATMAHFGMGPGALSYIKNKSMQAKTTQEAAC